MIITEPDLNKTRFFTPPQLLRILPNNTVLESLKYGPAHKNHHPFSPCHLHWFHSYLHTPVINSLSSIQREFLKYKRVPITFSLTNFQRIPIALEWNPKSTVYRAPVNPGLCLLPCPHFTPLILPFLGPCFWHSNTAPVLHLMLWICTSSPRSSHEFNYPFIPLPIY